MSTTERELRALETELDVLVERTMKLTMQRAKRELTASEQAELQSKTRELASRRRQADDRIRKGY